jgi:DNA-binding XRE family transcriptional regulator
VEFIFFFYFKNLKKSKKNILHSVTFCLTLGITICNTTNTMKINQTKIAKAVGVKPCFINLCLHGKRRPSWKLAKKLGETTNTSPEVWLEGSPEQIIQSIKDGYERLQKVTCI